jgi:hypothetical protein
MKRISTIDRERDLILAMLSQCGGSRNQVCKTLGIHREFAEQETRPICRPRLHSTAIAKGVDCERRASSAPQLRSGKRMFSLLTRRILTLRSGGIGAAVIDFGSGGRHRLHREYGSRGRHGFCRK